MNQIYWTKYTKPNLFNQPYKTESNQPILPNQIYGKLKVQSQLELSLAQLIPSLLSNLSSIMLLTDYKNLKNQSKIGSNKGKQAQN